MRVVFLPTKSAVRWLCRRCRAGGVGSGKLVVLSVEGSNLNKTRDRRNSHTDTLCHPSRTPSRQLVQRRSRASTPELSWCWCGWWRLIQQKVSTGCGWWRGWRLIHWQQKVPVSTEQDPSGSESGGASDHPNTHSESLLNRCHPQRARKRPRGRRLAGRCRGETVGLAELGRTLNN